MMKIKWFASLTFLTVLAVTIPNLFSLPRQELIAQPQPQETLDAYIEALEDAAKIDRDEVLNSLTVIVNSDPDLYWDRQGRVLVVTFTDDRYQSGDLIQSGKVWVTAAPQLKNFCEAYMKENTEIDSEKLNQRIEQVVGVKPNSGYTKIAEIWVHPKYLKRPTYDPDPTRYDPQKTWNYIQTSSFPNQVDSIYKDWLNEQITEQKTHLNRETNLSRLTDSNQYNDPYPWTGLGYTYDWGVYPKTPLETDAGFSEFVIFLSPNMKLEHPIEVNRVFSTEDYCR